MPSPRKRRGPKQFHRPSVEIGRHGKCWMHLRADQVTIGDIVPGIGVVRAVEESDDSTEDHRPVVALSGPIERLWFPFDEVLRVFGERR